MPTTPRRRNRALAAAACAALLLTAGAGAAVTGLYYQEVEKDGTIYVFNTPERYKAFMTAGQVHPAITLVARGPNGETVVGENETAVDLFLFKHNLPAYDRPTLQADPPAAAAFARTTIGGRVYADATSKEIKDDATGAKTGDSGVGVDVKRFYLTATHDFDAAWSAQFQTDIGDAGAKRYDVFVKKANVQLRLDDAAILRVGAADTPWIPFVEGLYGQRYFENTLTDALGFGTSAEWGLHFLGRAAGNMLGYAFTIGNGKGYSSPSRSRSVDLEGRVSFEPMKGLTLAVGGYTGKRGQDTDAAPARHTASRFDALANWVVGPVKIGAEYFTADNWNRVTQATQDSSDGYSGWLQLALDKEWTLFGRYDNAKPSKTLNPALQYSYYSGGIQWRPVRPVTAALAYKHGESTGGSVATSNGAIGSTKAGFKGTYDEIGLWLSYDF